jgi:DNA-binding CsgD family transcriptional regulator
VITDAKEPNLANGVRPQNGSVSAEFRRRPALIVKVDAATVGPEGEPAHQCEVTLVRSLRESNGQQSDADGGELTAVVILRDATISHLVSCVRAATRGGSIPPELLRQLLPAGEATQQEPSGPQLSEREYNVLRMLADGESTRGMAERLSYSERTVKNIVHDLLLKLNCKTRAHAVAFATRQGVI